MGVLAGMISLTMLWSLFMQVFLFTSGFSKLGGNDTDRLSLLEFKAKALDPRGVLSSWNESLHFCQWQGVTCGRRHQRVTRLDVYSSKLGGYLSPHIGNLSFLRVLNLHGNNFIGEIPEQIGRLSRLQSLVLLNNSLSGKIPGNITRCSKLQSLYLYYNNLTGEIPRGMGLLSNLKELSLYRNSLSGEIPDSIGNLSESLEVVAIEMNKFHGRIPGSFDQLKRLKFLGIGGNNFTGTIPPSIYNLSSIQTFSVHTNNLQGHVPPNLGHLVFPNLKVYKVHTNRFTGPIPVISNGTNLEWYEISSNHFTGRVPDFPSLPNLKYLALHVNNLGYGQDDDLNFLYSLVNCTNLGVLTINDNNFGGVLPERISNFSRKLWYMAFGRNRIKGGIPTGIGNLINLEVLGLETNKFIGPIPYSIVKLQNLFQLALDGNKISGTIPSSLNNLTSLGVLSLNHNFLQGQLPASLGECRNLAVLDVSGNNLSGLIPKEVIGLPSLSIFLDLSQNFFTGTIPSEVGKLMSLGGLDISDNELSGEIPETLGSCESLENLYLQGNFLQGTIPQSFDSLKGIRTIDLSRNNLSGKIPTYLEDLKLQALNLSFNNFDGEIPTQGVFANSSAVSVVGNARLCGGIPQLNLPKCPSNSNKKHKLSHKQKLVVSVTCGLVAVMLVALLLMLLCWTRKGKEKLTLGLPFGISFLEVSYGDLLKATDGFSSANLIGVGSFGSVYKGILQGENALEVAVKVLNLQTSKAMKSFKAECKVLKTIRHRNLVKLLTACSSIDFQGNDFKALVYELMTNGSLEEWLHRRHRVNSDQERHLDLIQRMNIAIDVANALDYLHNHCHVPIVHADLKPSNILLDRDMNSRLGDFGLARFLSDPSCPISSGQSSSICIRGSIGYIAPEYAMGGELSREGDVYSYGIFLLEMFTGKRPTDEMFKDSFNLHNFVKMSLPERLVQIVDSTLLVQTNQDEGRTATSVEEIYAATTTNNNLSESEIDQVEEIAINNSQNMPESENIWKCLHSVLKIAISCSEKTPNERMDMADVIKELLQIRNSYTRNVICGNQRRTTN